MQDAQGVGFGAKCALHPDRTATRTCSRCGNFTCDECNVGGSELQCPTCRTLTGGEAFPFSRTSFSFDGIWNYAFEKWKQEWVMLAVCVLILIAVGFVVGLFNSLFQTIARVIIGERGGQTGVIAVVVVATIMSQVVSALAQGAFQMGLYRVYMDVLNGRKADVARMMTQLPKLGRYILQYLAIFVMVAVPVILYVGLLIVVAAAVSGLSLGNLDRIERDFQPIAAVVLVFGFLLLIPVLYYVALPLQFASMELVYGDSSPIESIRRAYQIANGFRFNIFGYGFIGGLVVLVGLFACCIGMIPAIALAQMLLVGLYLSLRNGSGLPPPPEP